MLLSVLPSNVTTLYCLYHQAQKMHIHNTRLYAIL